jgi:GntR family transcriptional regulator
MRIDPAPDRLLGQITLERNGVPIYVQIRDQVLQAIRAGLVGSGERLPTMRQVAVALRVDLNTVRHAYDELERLGALTLERGRGTFVSEGLASPAGDPERTRALAAQILIQARAAGVDPAQLAQALSSLIEEGESP